VAEGEKGVVTINVRGTEEHAVNAGKTVGTTSFHTHVAPSWRGIPSCRRKQHLVAV
jgi:hypothetical protein